MFTSSHPTLGRHTSLGSTALFNCLSLIRNRASRTQASERVVRQRSFQEPSDSSSGDSKVQDVLVNMIKLEIGKKQVEDYVEESSEKLKSMAEEAKEEMERLAELARLRGDVAFDSAIADINKEADEFEEQLRRSREENEARDKEFMTWEDDMAVSRSEGQFFKTLYPSSFNRKQLNDGSASAEELKARAARVTEPAKQEIKSPLRLYLFLALAFLLAADVGADLSSDQPSLGPDVLYTSLAALAVFLAFNERRELP